jgi:hypothetical protein
MVRKKVVIGPWYYTQGVAAATWVFLINHLMNSTDYSRSRTIIGSMHMALFLASSFFVSDLLAG